MKGLQKPPPYMTSKFLCDLTPTCPHSFVSQITSPPALLNVFCSHSTENLGSHWHSALFWVSSLWVILRTIASYPFKTHSRSPCFHERNRSVVVPALRQFLPPGHRPQPSPPRCLTFPHTPPQWSCFISTQDHYMSPGTLFFLQILTK